MDTVTNMYMYYMYEQQDIKQVRFDMLKNNLHVLYIQNAFLCPKYNSAVKEQNYCLYYIVYS